MLQNDNETVTDDSARRAIGINPSKSSPLEIDRFLRQPLEQVNRSRNTAVRKCTLHFLRQELNVRIQENIASDREPKSDRLIRCIVVPVWICSVSFWTIWIFAVMFKVKRVDQSSEIDLIRNLVLQIKS